MFCAPIIKTSKWHMMHIFFSVRLWAFKCKVSSLSKTFLLFVKIVRLCATHKHMIITLDKKSGPHLFCAPMRFQVQRFNSQKLLFYFGAVYTNTKNVASIQIQKVATFNSDRKIINLIPNKSFRYYKQ